MAIDCNNPKNQQEENLCTCQKATNALVSSLERYERDYTNYTSKLTEYNQAYKSWQDKHGEWRRNRDGERQRLADEDSYRGCGACGSNAGCQGGWRWERNNNGCHGSWLPGTGCEQVCRRNNDTIDRDMSGWYSRNSEPGEPNKGGMVPDPPKPPENNTIQCCSQIFSDIQVQGGNATLKDINQNCSLRIQQTLTAPPPPAPATPTPPPRQPPISGSGSSPSTSGGSGGSSGGSKGGDDNKRMMMIIIIAIIVLILIASVVLALTLD